MYVGVSIDVFLIVVDAATNAVGAVDVANVDRVCVFCRLCCWCTLYQCYCCCYYWFGYVIDIVVNTYFDAGYDTIVYMLMIHCSDNVADIDDAYDILFRLLLLI